jgi:hypothetical protein
MEREFDIATKNDNTITTPKIKNGLTFITFYQYYHYLNTLSTFVYDALFFSLTIKKKI